jgi:hypothetical protein
MAFIVSVFITEVSKISICFHCVSLKHSNKLNEQISVSL